MKKSHNWGLCEKCGKIHQFGSWIEEYKPKQKKETKYSYHRNEIEQTYQFLLEHKSKCFKGDRIRPDICLFINNYIISIEIETTKTIYEIVEKYIKESIDFLVYMSPKLNVCYIIELKTFTPEMYKNTESCYNSTINCLKKIKNTDLNYLIYLRNPNLDSSLRQSFLLI